MKTTLFGAIACAVCLLAGRALAQAQQQPVQQPTDQSKAAKQPYAHVPPQTLGPLDPALAPQQPEQEIVYLGHEQARLGVTLAEDHKGHVWIRSVIAGSPADRAHLRPGDRIVAMNEAEIHSYADAVRFINASHPDQEVTVAINRDGTPGGTTAVLGWARGVQSNTLTVPSGSIQFQIRTPNQTYNPEYVYPNKPGEYKRPWQYGHQGTAPDNSKADKAAAAATAPSSTEGIGGAGNGVGRGPGQPGEK